MKNYVLFLKMCFDSKAIEHNTVWAENDSSHILSDYGSPSLLSLPLKM